MRYIISYSKLMEGKSIPISEIEDYLLEFTDDPNCDFEIQKPDKNNKYYNILLMNDAKNHLYRNYLLAFKDGIPLDKLDYIPLENIKSKLYKSVNISSLLKNNKNLSVFRIKFFYPKTTIRNFIEEEYTFDQIKKYFTKFSKLCPNKFNLYFKISSVSEYSSENRRKAQSKRLELVNAIIVIEYL